MYETIDLGGSSPMGKRARGRWRARLRNLVMKVPTFGGGARLASGSFHPAGGGGRRRWWRRRHRGFAPAYYYPYTYYPYLQPYAWYQPYYYPTYTAPTYTQTVPASCCYDPQSGTLYCPGSQYDGAPAYAEATREYQGRLMSFVTSPKLAQGQWFWNCPSGAAANLASRGGRTYLRAY